ncbi:hypothetical protein POTOM_019922 [Populus tomentosa]|uniref:Nucleotide-binding protein-like n=1 Tax=Populus tomentosa TaxID=118781 RepID=A0A8X7ZUY9_POPTO|nr:hypothetical protein POTOM_019922 [Populus tomentosa]
MMGFLGPLSRLGSIRSYSGTFKRSQLRLEGVKDVIAVASGKGGVGKSTTAANEAIRSTRHLPLPFSLMLFDLIHIRKLVGPAVNLAVALAIKCQLKVGLLDADVYGPSVPMMMKIDWKPDITEDKKMIPIENYGVKCMSIGFLVEKDAPIVWRGPMVMSALVKMTRGVDWGNLDILVVDMPPGTGDAQLTMTQNLQLSGALIVSTPQDIALLDARRGANMFSKVGVPILGFVENMSFFKCPHCGEPSFIFGKEGARNAAASMGHNFLGEIPLEVDVRKGSDEGIPVVISAPDSVISKAYGDTAQNVVNKLEELANEPSLHPEINL